MSSDSEKIGALKAQLAAKYEELNDNANLEDDSASKLNFQGSMKTRRMLKGHFGKVYSMHWAGEKDADKLVSASQDGKLIIWNADSMNKCQAIPLRSSWVMTCAYERGNNKFVACGGLDNLCSVYEVDQDGAVAASKATRELAHHDGYLSCCRFFSENEMITSSGDSTCILWDIQGGTPTGHFHHHTSDVMSVDISPTSPNVFCSGSCDARAIVWDTRTKGGEVAGMQPTHFAGHESDINSVVFFPNGHSIGTGSDDSSCRIFDMRCFNSVGEYAHDRILCGVTSVSFSLSGRLLFSGYDDHYLYAWDVVKSDKESFMFHDNRVSCIGTESRGMCICTGSWDTLLKVHVCSG